MNPAAGLLRCSFAKERQLSTHVKGVHRHSDKKVPVATLKVSTSCPVSHVIVM